MNVSAKPVGTTSQLKGFLMHRFLFAAALTFGLTPAAYAQELDGKTKKLVGSCQNLIFTVDDMDGQELSISDDVKKKYRLCKELVDRFSVYGSLKEEAEEKIEKNQALREETAALSKESYDLALDNFLKVSAPGSKWSREKDCEILFVTKDTMIVQIKPANLDTARSTRSGLEELRLYPSNKDGIRRILDRKMNSKPMSRFDYALNTEALKKFGNAAATELLDQVLAGIETMRKHCAQQ